ncbi:MAG TPA: TnsA-like heteromeric transposase endonuclease subunit [Streptosporangiaceae bacterium]
MVGWEHRLVGAPNLIWTANLRWLAGYRHPRRDLPGLAAALRVAFAGPVPLLAGAEAVGDPIAVLPVLFHLLWRHDLVADLSVPLHSCTSVTTAVTGPVA